LSTPPTGSVGGRPRPAEKVSAGSDQRPLTMPFGSAAMAAASTHQRVSKTGVLLGPCGLPYAYYGTRFYRIEMLALLNDMIIVDRYLWE
jgi:hypothetical protein